MTQRRGAHGRWDKSAPTFPLPWGYLKTKYWETLEPAGKDPELFYGAIKDLFGGGPGMRVRTEEDAVKVVELLSKK